MLEVFVFGCFMFVIVASILNASHKDQQVRFVLRGDWSWCNEIDKANGITPSEVRTSAQESISKP